MDDVRHRVASVDRRAIIMNPGLLESSLLSSRDPQVVPWHTSWARRGGTAATSAGCCMDQRTRADVSAVDSQCLAAEGARAASEHRAMEGQFLRSTRPAIMSRPLLNVALFGLFIMTCLVKGEYFSWLYSLHLRNNYLYCMVAYFKSFVFH